MTLMVLFTISVHGAFAQQVDPASLAAKENEKRLQEESMRRQNQQESQQQTPNIFLQPESEAVTNQDAANKTCFDIKEIHVQGVVFFDKKIVENITAPYLNRCLGLTEINQLVKAISGLYMSKGLVTSRAFVQPQNLASGVLEILVVEGKLEKLESENDSLNETQLHWAFPITEGNILNLRDLEQGLEQLNRLQQNHSELDLQPGSDTGTSRALIRNSQGSAWHYGGGFNNSGSDATGKTIATAFMSWDNPVNHNDNLYISVNDAIHNDKYAESKSIALTYSLPVGYGLYSYSSNYFEYQQMVKGNSTNFITSGSSLNQTLSGDYTVYRGQNDKLSLSSNFTRKENKNYLENVYLDTSSRVLYVLDLGVNYTHPLARGMFHTALKWYKSFNWFDAKTKIVTAERNYQFNKYTLDISLNKQFGLFGYDFNYSGNAYLFYSPKVIIASEALSLGGRYSIRGIEGESLTGYKGGYLRNEIAHTTNLFKGNFSTFIGADIGKTDTPEYPSIGYETLAGSVVGIRYANKNINLDLTYAHALRMPSYLPGDRHGVYASLQSNF